VTEATNRSSNGSFCVRPLSTDRHSVGKDDPVVVERVVDRVGRPRRSPALNAQDAP